MYLVYNGVALDVENVVEFSQRAVFSPSGKDKLSDHYRITVVAVWGPDATNELDGSGNPQMAAKSLADLRSLLMAPRKVLVFHVPDGNGSTTLLVRSPLRDASGQTFPCDLDLGPTPLELTVLSWHGECSAIVRFSIETHISDCDFAHPCTSNRWQMSHSLSRQMMTTRTIQGEAQFRADFLYLPAGAQIHADAFRRDVIPPCANGFQRTDQTVSVSEDGLTLRYTTTDTEMWQNISPTNANGVVKVEGSFSDSVGTGSITLRNSLAGAKSESGAASLLGMASDFINSQPPRTTHLNLRVWGRKTITRDSLVRVIQRILVSFNMGNGRTFLEEVRNFFLVTTTLVVDMWEKYAEANVVYRSNYSYHALLQVFSAAPPSAVAQAPRLPELLGDVGRDNSFLQAPGPGFGKDGNTRGDVVAPLVAANLTTECEFPPPIDSSNINSNQYATNDPLTYEI